MKNTEYLSLRKKVKKLYNTYMPGAYWGDDLDVRYKLISELMTIENAKVLDIGCNVGLALHFMKNRNCKVGIDIDERLLNSARILTPSAEFIECDMFKFDYYSVKYDLAVMMNVVPGYDFMLPQENDINACVLCLMKKIYENLKVGGRILLTTPNGDSWDYMNKNKMSYKSLISILNQLNATKVNIYGWNYMSAKKWYQILQKVPIVRYIVHPRITCHFAFVWNWIEKNMDKNIDKSKYFYVEILK